MSVNNRKRQCPKRILSKTQNNVTSTQLRVCRTSAKPLTAQNQNVAFMKDVKTLESFFRNNCQHHCQRFEHIEHMLKWKRRYHVQICSSSQLTLKAVYDFSPQVMREVQNMSPKTAHWGCQEMFS